MRSYRQEYIYDLSAEKIYEILEKDAWIVKNQQCSSASTNTQNKEVKNEIFLDNTEGTQAFKDINFDSSIDRVLDLGGGKYDCNISYMKKNKNINLMVWDPYNRSSQHNDKVKNEVREKKVDAATSMSVLNVIPECEGRLAHIATVKDALSLNGRAYFKVWPGTGTNIPCVSKDDYQANSNALRFLDEIEIVFGHGNVSLDSKIPNLIIAAKKSEKPTALEEIKAIQKQLKNKICTDRHGLFKQSKGKSVDTADITTRKSMGATQIAEIKSRLSNRF